MLVESGKRKKELRLRLRLRVRGGVREYVVDQRDENDETEPSHECDRNNDRDP